MHENKELNPIEDSIIVHNNKNEVLTEEEKKIIIENIINDLEYDKTSIPEENIEDKKDLNIKKSNKKYISIEIEENNKSFIETNTEKDNIKEVKNRKFDLDIPIDKKVYYEGSLFYEDSRHTSNYPQTINYRCKYYRKDERIRKTQFCNALLKRNKENNFVYFILEKPHSHDCNDLRTNIYKNESNLIGNYNDYINKCFKYLDSTEDYNKNEYKIKLQNIFNENKYNFQLKPNTIKNIIGRWKQNSLRFTKYNAIENKFNKDNELILWEYNNVGIFTSNKKLPIPSEYFIWSSNQIIARSRLSNHLFIDGTFHHPEKYSQLLIILFKDIVTSEYYPCFYILMSNKTEILYDMIFKSVKRILTQNNLYSLKFKTITTDTEIALINAINNNFIGTQRIGCWFHLKQDLKREAKNLGLLNKKNPKFDPEITLEVITQLSLLPLEYNGNIDYLLNKLDILAKQYPLYYNFIKTYMVETKLKYFKDGSFNYNNFPKDIRSNSILERYNKIIKQELGAKRTCNWVVFINFINKEIIRINDILSKNENINVLYNSKYTKFGKEKYISPINETNSVINNSIIA